MSRPVCHLLRLPPSFGVRRGLALEEALLRHDPLRRDWCVTTTGPARPTIVLGISGKPRLLVDLDACLAGVEAGRLELVRRFTGGGTVVLGRDSLLVSWIVRRATAEIVATAATATSQTTMSPRDIMEWSEVLYRPMMHRLLQPGVAGTFGLRENDYILGDFKFAGNAQAITRGDFCHHTSFLWDWDPAHMALLKQPLKQPDYRRRRTHADFLTPLHAHVRDPPVEGEGESERRFDGFWAALVHAGRQQFDVVEAELDATLHELEASLRAAGFDGLRGWESGVAVDGTSAARGARTRALTAADLWAEKELELPDASK